LEDQSCLQCHTVRGQGSGHEANQIAPDLAGRIVPTYGPATLASALWNHAPAMWTELSARGMPPPAASESEWQDVFAYLYALPFSEPPAEVRRGQEVLESKGCANCHTESKPVSTWSHMDDPVTLVFQLWNHAAAMKKEIAANQKQWKTLTGRDLMDLTAYAQNVQHLAPTRTFSLPAPESGKVLFEANCGSCHRGSLSLATRLRNKTWMDIGAGMWNHAPKMRAVPLVSTADMAKILAYVWQVQYEGPAGNPVLGRRAFVEKHCAHCHRDAATGAVRNPRPGKTFTPFSMIGVGWGPGRQMHHRMQQEGIQWPKLTPADVSNLVAYLNSLH
jgi:mono/diheme cytochrome c family protein